MTPSRASLPSVLAAVALAATLVAPALREPRPPFLLGGIQVNEPDHGRWLAALRREGFDTVSVTVYAKHGDWDGDALWWDEDEPYVLAEIRAARRAGLRVVLIPRVALDHAFPRNAFLWHGMILPGGDDRLRAWFERYRAFVLRWAAVAEREGVALFGLGSELSALTATRPVDAVPALEAWYLDADAQARRRADMLAVGDRLDAGDLAPRGRDAFPTLEAFLDAEIAAHRAWAERAAFAGHPDAVARINRRSAILDRSWRDLVADVREVYRGRLTYAANFDRYDRVGFWDALDAVGINAYWELRPGDRELPGPALEAALEDGWSAVLDGIDGFLSGAGLARMPVVFTEIGYTGRRNATVRPWAGSGFWLRPDGPRGPELFVWEDEPLDLAERAVAIRALGGALAGRGGPDRLAGALWWKLSTVPSHRAIEPFVAILGDEADADLFEALRDLAARRVAPTPPGVATTAGTVY